MDLGINDIKEITSAMSEYPDMDYSNYSMSFLKRRLSYAFALLNLRRLNQLPERLKDPNFRDKLISNLSVDATEMFRDPAVWRLIRDKVLSDMPKESEKIWFPAEANGAEVFSLSIILHESSLTDNYKLICQSPSIIRCNSINDGAISAGNNEINQTNYKRLENQNAYNSYFETADGQINLLPYYRRNIECLNECFLSKPLAENSAALIMFRNISLYYNHKLTKTAFRLLTKALVKGGYLVIGIKERLPEDLIDEFEVIDANENIYRKTTTINSRNHA